jgi:hypothetical protein
MPCCFHAHTIIPLTARLFLFHTHTFSLSIVSLSSPKPADGFSPAAKNCINGGGLASSPLHRCFIPASLLLGHASHHHQRASISAPAGFQPPPSCNVGKQITLNPYLLQSTYLLTVRRHTLVYMHSGFARFRIRSKYCSGGVVSPFDMPMMDRMCAQLMNIMCGQT